MSTLRLRGHRVAWLALLSTCLAQPTNATITGVGGNATLGGSASGLDLTPGSAESSSVVGLDENQCVSVPGGTVQVDYLITPGDFGVQLPGVSDPPAMGILTLPAGTYSSHILRFDPVGAVGGSVNNAVFNFDTPVFAAIANQTFLNASDGVLGNAAIYDTGLGRRFEIFDLFTVNSATQLTVDVAAAGAAFTDELRVVTSCAAVPAASPLELAFLALLLVGGGLVVLLRRQVVG